MPTRTSPPRSATTCARCRPRLSSRSRRSRRCVVLCCVGGCFFCFAFGAFCACGCAAACGADGDGDTQPLERRARCTHTTPHHTAPHQALTLEQEAALHAFCFPYVASVSRRRLSWVFLGGRALTCVTAGCLASSATKARGHTPLKPRHPTKRPLADAALSGRARALGGAQGRHVGRGLGLRHGARSSLASARAHCGL